MIRPVRPFLALSTAALLVAATQLFSISAAQARAGQGLPAQHHGTTLSSPAGPILSSPANPGNSDVTDLGAAGWTVQSSAVATQSGAQISTPGFNTSSWLPVANDDAGAPGTEIEAL